MTALSSNGRIGGVLKMLMIGLFASLGALSRWALVEWLGDKKFMGFPLALQIVNLGGSFLVGLLTSVFVTTLKSGAWLGPAVMVGFLGAFTTYSAFSLELVTGPGPIHHKISWALIKVFMAFTLCFLGMEVGSWLQKFAA